MSCDATRERMMELDVSQFDELEHLQTCEACRAFAEEIRATEDAMSGHVRAFEEAGDFAADWENALAEAEETEEVGGSGRRWVYVAVPLLMAAIGLLFLVPVLTMNMVEPTPTPEPAAPAPALAPEPAPVRDTGEPAVPAMKPKPKPRPTSAPKPAPRPAPRPAPAPAPAPDPSPEPDPEPEPSPAPPPEAPTRTVRVTGIPAPYTNAEIKCDASMFRARFSVEGGTVAFPNVPLGSCVVSLKGGQPVQSEPFEGNSLTYTDGTLAP